MRPGKNKPITLIDESSVGSLYRSPMPRGRYDVGDLVYGAWLENKIDIVVSLTPEHEFVEKSGANQIHSMIELGFDVIHLPIADRGTIASAEIETIVSKVIRKLNEGQNVTVHCSAGIGRTGMILACILSSLHKWSTSKSVQFLNSLTPSIGPENYQQMDLVDRFVEDLNRG